MSFKSTGVTNLLLHVDSSDKNHNFSGVNVWSSKSTSLSNSQRESVRLLMTTSTTSSISTLLSLIITTLSNQTSGDTHSLTYSLLLWLTTLGLPRLCQDPPQLAQHRVLDGVLPGVLQLLGQHRVLLPAEPLPDLQGVGDRRLRGGQDLPHTPAQRRRVPPESGGHHRGGLPREGPGCGRRENQGTFFWFWRKNQWPGWWSSSDNVNSPNA